MDNALGFQTTIDFYGCNATKINSVKFMEEILVIAAKKMHLTVVKTTIHAFSPIGVTGVIVIQESHLAIHTWPEYNYVALDFFTCNKAYDLQDGIAWLKEQFQAGKMEVSSVKRGDIQKAILHKKLS